jgi:nucleotide-binding universal stress UspA family protein
MIAYDDSPEAGRALRVSIELAKALRAELCVVTVLEPLPSYYSFAISAVPAVHWTETEEKRARYSALQAEARQQAKDAGLVLDTELISGDEVGTIIDCTKRPHSDLLVLGMRKHSWLLAGHTAKDLIERAPCALRESDELPVLLYRCNGGTDEAVRSRSRVSNGKCVGSCVRRVRRHLSKSGNASRLCRTLQALLD